MGFSIRTFKKHEGHCRVPRFHIEGTFKLGQWVAYQRSHKTIVSAERRKRLEAIGFVWEPYEDAWEEGFAVLRKFKNARVTPSPLKVTSKASTALEAGWVTSVEPEAPCLLNAENGWKQSDLFGTRSKLHGNKVLRY